MIRLPDTTREKLPLFESARRGGNEWWIFVSRHNVTDRGTRGFLDRALEYICMAGDNPVLCPECGWSGTDAALEQRDDVRACPVCDTDIEIIE